MDSGTTRAGGESLDIAEGRVRHFEFQILNLKIVGFEMTCLLERRLGQTAVETQQAASLRRDCD
jgi:hypothetical protein